MCIRIILGLGSAVLLFVRFYWPDVQVDVTTILLLLLLVVALCWPSLRRLLPFIKSVSVGGFEVSMGDAIKELSSKAEKAEEEKKIRPMPAVAPTSLVEEVEEVDTVARTSPEAAILLLSAKLERALRNIACATSLSSQARGMPPHALIRALAEARVLSNSTVAALNDFRAIRNRVAHGVDASRVDLDAILGIGARLLTTVTGMQGSAEPSP
jgi:hypothetical protein